MIRIATQVLAILTLCAAVAGASSRTDVVMLGNGDRFTGEITRLSRGRLELKTDDAGTIDIEWDKIVSVEAGRRFEIITSNGRRLLGAFRRGRERFLSIVTDEGVVTLPLLEVTDIVPVGASFWSRLDGSFDAGFNYTRSSGIATTTLGAATSFRKPSFVAQMTFSSTVTQNSTDATGDDRAALELSYLRYRGRRRFVSSTFRLENNERLGIVLRTQLAGQVGLRVVNTNRTDFSIGGGLVVNDEQPVDEPARQNIEGLVGMSMAFNTYDRPKTDITASFQYYPSFSDWGRQRLQLDSSIRRELLKDFYTALTVFDTFDSAPPNPGSLRNDVGVVVSIGWSY